MLDLLTDFGRGTGEFLESFGSARRENELAGSERFVNALAAQQKELENLQAKLTQQQLELTAGLNQQAFDYSQAGKAGDTANAITLGTASTDNTIRTGDSQARNQAFLANVGGDVIARTGRSAANDQILVGKATTDDEIRKGSSATRDELARRAQQAALIEELMKGPMASDRQQLAMMIGDNPTNSALDRVLAHQKGMREMELGYRPRPFNPGRQIFGLAEDVARAGLANLLAG